MKLSLWKQLRFQLLPGFILAIVTGCHNVDDVSPDVDSDTTSQGTDSVTETVWDGCGDGVVTSDEACDDGNRMDSDGCASDCLSVSPGFSCVLPGKPCLTHPVCGDGLISHTEQCDPGPDTDTNCMWFCEPVEVCADQPIPCAPSTCGNGEIDYFEQCDDGINDGGYGECGPTCLLGAYCGDGFLDSDYEECDDGNFVNGDGCPGTCWRTLVP